MITDLVAIAATDEDATVGVVTGPEFHVENEILLRILGNEIGGRATGALVGDKHTVF